MGNFHTAITNEYKLYLKSPKWKAIAKLVKNNSDNKCSKCGRTENLAVHHINYKIWAGASPRFKLDGGVCKTGLPAMPVESSTCLDVA